MALDRFLTAKKGRKTPLPTSEEVEPILRNFLNNIGEVSRKKVWLSATLPGKPSFSFRHVYPRRQEAIDDLEVRVFEVFCGEDSLSVITRQADCFTNAVADGFANLLAMYCDLKHGL